MDNDLPQSKLSADHEHFFEEEIINKGPFTHVRLTIFPDGGVSRMRLWGRVSPESLGELRSMSLY